MIVSTAVSSLTEPSAVSYLGRGIYDIAEVARLIRKTRGRVEGWTRPRSGKPPLLTGELAGLFSFWDLISLRVIAELIDRGVPRDAIATGAEHLARSLGTDRPFAHEKLATVGAGFFADITDGWEDAGLGGQLAFQSTIEPLLEPITFNEASMAMIWRPCPCVWINPEVQAGAPCVDGTRVPTSQIAGLLDIDNLVDEKVDLVCDDYRITSEQVRAALDYEFSLVA